MTHIPSNDTINNGKKLISFPDIRDALQRVSCSERATTSVLDASSILQFWLWGGDANDICVRS